MSLPIVRDLFLGICPFQSAQGLSDMLVELIKWPSLMFFVENTQKYIYYSLLSFYDKTLLPLYWLSFLIRYDQLIKGLHYSNNLTLSPLELYNTATLLNI